jgi:hypothetical protein
MQHRPGNPEDTPPERPRSEPEIIPPNGDRRSGASDPDARVFVYVDRDGRTQRVNVKTPGPFSIILILLTLALIAAVIFALVVGALFFLIPIAAVSLAALIAWFYARNFWYRLRGK